MSSVVSNLVSDEAESCIWQVIEPSSAPTDRPAGRCGHVAVACGGGQRLVLFGGYNADGILRDVWQFDLESREWAAIRIAAGPEPPERAYFRGCTGPPAGTEDREVRDGFLYIFGGTDAEGNSSNDLWRLDIENRAWEEVHGGGGQDMTVTAPCSRSNHSMCEANGLLVVHGGESSSGTLLDDLWLFEPATAYWSHASTSSEGPRPCARSSHCIAAGPARVSTPAGQDEGAVASGSSLSLVLFGGLGRDPDESHNDSDADEAMPLNDLWVLSRVVPVTLGGDGGLGSDGSMHDRDGPGVWSSVILNGVGPSPRSLAALSSPHPGSGDLFLFGGYGLVELPAPVSADADGEDDCVDIIMAYIDDLWRLDIPNPNERRDGCGEGDGSENEPRIQWVDEDDMGFPGESIVEGRNGHSLTWCRGKLVLFGGFVGDGFDASVHVADAPSSSSRPAVSLPLE